MNEPEDYAALLPETVLAAVSELGYAPSGRMLALNSYENRVYRLEMEAAPALIVKFYRPGRWSDQAIQEEHDFAAQLSALEIPVVAPIRFDDRSLMRWQGYRFALYPVQGGRWPDLENRQDRILMGRFIGRIHALGSRATFQHRQAIDVSRMARQSSRFLLQAGFVPAHLEDAYRTLADDLAALLESCFEHHGGYSPIRLHGDCHRGNILWQDSGPHFVDLDDCCNGPAIQDLWMLLNGERAEMTEQLLDLLTGYEDFLPFDASQLALIEPLRCLRMMHYAAWLARRWQDPAFPQAFPWFNSDRYWEQHVLELREQFSRIQEPALVIQ